MGSAVTRHLRGLGDVGGFETLDGSNTGLSTPEIIPQTSAEACPATPTTPQTTTNQPVRVLEFDPRSPTAEIVRTPIEVASKFAYRLPQDSPMSSVLDVRRSYLETDLDTLSTSESSCKPGSASNEESSSLPAGLTSAHLMKLRFLGIDPRSPSSEVARTPIQLAKKHERGVSPLHFDDTLSVGSLSTHDIFDNSMCSSEFMRDCSDPSAIISESEDVSDKEEEGSVTEPMQESTKQTDDLAKSDSVFSDHPSESLPNVLNKVSVFQEDEVRIVEADKVQASTPEGNKKLSGNRARTPLTPIGNRNRTPNSILRAKQSQTIEKEILTKVKIYSTDEYSMSPSKVRQIGSSKKDNVTGRCIRKGITTNNENAPMSSAKKRILAQWDQDNSVVI